MQQYFDNELMERALLGASLYEWLLTLILWAGFAAGLILLVRLVVWRVAAFSQRTSNRLDDAAAEALGETRSYFLVALGLYLATLFTTLPPAADRIIGKLVFLVFLLQVILWGNGLISRWTEGYKELKMEKDAAAVTTVQAVGFIGRLALWVVTLLLALDNFGVDVTTLIAGLGVGGIAVALATQNILGDLFASLSIVLDKPFVVGDFLIVNDYLGSVEHIGLKTTRLRSLGGEQIIFSNSDLLSSRIRNYKRMYERRVVFTVGVTYQTPHEKLADISQMLRAAVEEQDQTRFDRAHFKDYGDFALTYEIVYYVLSPEYNVYMDIQERINLSIHRRFEDVGINFAYPTQTIYMNTSSVEGTPTAAQAPAATQHPPKQ